MSLFRGERRALPLNIDVNQVTARPAYSNWSGEVVNDSTAFTSSAIFSSVTLLADSVASMPLEVGSRKDGRWKASELPPVFRKPNAEQSMFEFVHQTVATVCLHGMAFIWCPQQGLYPTEMRNIHPNLVGIELNEANEVVYKIGRDIFSSDDIKVVNYMQLPNQLRSVSPLDSMRNLIGTDIAIARFLSAFYGDGATPSSVLETDQQLTSSQAEILRDTWVDTHYKRRRPAVLTGGLKWRPITTSATDMDTMAHREQIVREVARCYRIPQHLIGAIGGSSETYQNVESAGIMFVRHTLLPWMRRLEDLFNEMLPAGQTCHFNADEFLRADLMTRVRAAQGQIAAGMLTPNEARFIENREPYEGGDIFVLNLAGAPMAGPNKDQPLGTDAETTP